MYILNKIKGESWIFFLNTVKGYNQDLRFFFEYYNSKKCHGVHAVCAQLLSHVWLFVTARTVAQQAPLSIGFSQQEY